jgi:hypothetical protein
VLEWKLAPQCGGIQDMESLTGRAWWEVIRSWVMASEGPHVVSSHKSRLL